MTPEEKTLEIFDILKQKDFIWMSKGRIFSVKSNAIIMVNQILEVLKPLSHISEIKNEFNFWLEVKEYIHKLEIK